MRVYYLALKYLFVSHIKLQSGLIVDLSQLKGMIANYMSKTKRVLSSTLSSKYFGIFLTSLCELEVMSRKLVIPLPQLSLLIWEGLNKYFVVLSKYVMPDN